MSNPLVVMIQVEAVDPSLGSENIRIKDRLTLTNDAKNVFNVFHKQLHYDFAYGNDIIKGGKEIRELKVIVGKNASTSDFNSLSCPIIWKCEDIDEFNVTLSNKMGKGAYDGLIYFLTCSGTSDGKLIDSNYPTDYFKLDDIIRQFDKVKCKGLINKPKIFIIDSARGDKKELKLAGDSVSTIVKRMRQESSNTSVNTANSNYGYNDKSRKFDGMSIHIVGDNDWYPGRYIEILHSTVDGYTNPDDEKRSLMIESICQAAKEVTELSNLNSNDQDDTKPNSLAALGLRARLIAKTKLMDKKSQYLQVFETVSTMPVDILFNKSDIISQNGTKSTKNKKVKKNQTSSNSKATITVTSNNIAKSGKTTAKANRSSTSSKTNSLLKPNLIPIQVCRRPLIAIVCIGSAKTPNERQQLDHDYLNVIHTFNKTRKYALVYKTSDNEFNHLYRGVDSVNDVNNQFKIYWEESDIRSFNDQVKKLLQNDNFGYDGIIYFISSLAPSNEQDRICDTTGHHFSLQLLADQFDNKNFKKLRGKPKIFVINCDRGTSTSKKRVTPHIQGQPLKQKDSPQMLITSNSPSRNDYLTMTQADQQKTERLQHRANGCKINEFSKNSDCMFIFSTMARRKNVQATKDVRGSFLIRALTQTICNDRIFCKYNFHGLICHTRAAMHQLLSVQSQNPSDVQTIEVKSTMTRDFYLVKFIFFNLFSMLQHFTFILLCTNTNSDREHMRQHMI